MKVVLVAWWFVMGGGWSVKEWPQESLSACYAAIPELLADLEERVKPREFVVACLERKKI